MLRCRHLSAAFASVNKSKNIYFVQTWFNASTTWNNDVHVVRNFSMRDVSIILGPIHNASTLLTTLRTLPSCLLISKDTRAYTRKCSVQVCASERSFEWANIYFPATTKRASRVTFGTLSLYVNYCRYASVSFCFIFSFHLFYSSPRCYRKPLNSWSFHGRGQWRTSALSNE